MTFEEIYAKHFVKAVRYAKRRYPGLNDDDANQIVADSFLKLLERMNQGREVRHLNAWLRKVIHWHYVDFIRHQLSIKRGKGWQQEQRPIIVEHTDFADVDNLDTIQTIIRQLAPAMQQLANLVFINGLSCPEAAKHLGISVRTVERRVERLRKTIQDEFSEVLA